jgi:hypothetical protein
LPANYFISRAESFKIPSIPLIVSFATAGIDIVLYSFMRIAICIQLNNDQILLITYFPNSYPMMIPIITA